MPNLPMVATMPTITQLSHAIDERRASVSRRSEHGFGLIEILVALLIMMILLGMIVTTFKGSKEATYFRVGIAAGGVYADAVEAFMADNGQVAPLIGSSDWPDARRGPVDAMLNGRPYMRTIPDPVQSGLAVLLTNGSSPAGSQVALDYITYPTSPSDFTIRVRTLHVQKDMTCVITNRASLGAGEKRCE